jgi:ribosome-associated protein
MNIIKVLQEVKMDINSKLHQMLKIINEKKFVSLKTIDISKISSFCDYFIIVSTDSMRQNNSMSDEFLDKLKESNIEPDRIEGMNTDWVLIDFGDIIVHFFTEEKHLFYNLEKVWADGIVQENI